MARTITILWCCWITLYLPLPVDAATFCVGTSEELHNALITAQSNNQDDEIRLQTGTYRRAMAEFSYFSNQTNALEIIGGWTKNCIANPNPTNVFKTTISGDGIHRALRISSNGNVAISRIHFSRGNANVGAGLNLTDNSGTIGDVSVDRCVFANNVSDSGSALRYSSTQTITIRNSLFVQNTGPTIIEVGNSGVGLYFINNTVADNVGTGPSGRSGDFLLVNGAQTVIANNIFWRNEGVDLQVRVPNDQQAFIRNNIIGNYEGPPLDSSNLNADPQFDAPLNTQTAYLPKPLTPQVEAGTPLPLTLPLGIAFELAWSVGPLDLRGFNRIQGNRVDIGAYEFPFLFKDGFE